MPNSKPPVQQSAVPTRRLAGALAAQVAESLWPWVRNQRWCPANRGDDSAIPVAQALWELTNDASEPDRAWLLVLRAGKDGPLLQIPLTARREDAGEAPVGQTPTRGENPIGTAGGWRLADGALAATFWREWARRARVVSGTRGDLERACSQVTSLEMEQSNTSVILDGGPQRLIAKVFRVLHSGINPEVELPAALTSAGWQGVPRLYATWDLPPLDPADPGTEPICSAVVSEAIRDATDGFDLFVDLARTGEDPGEDAATLGRTVAQMHRELLEALGPGTPLSAHRFTERARMSVHQIPGQSGHRPQDSRPENPDPSNSDSLIAALIARLDLLERKLPIAIATQRIHGDLHLGQTLRTADGSWYVLDFEGEPLKPVSQRAAAGSPAQDVAGMLRSFDYAWKRGHGGADEEQWSTRARQAFLKGYEEESGPSSTPDDVLQNIMEIEKGAYELRYEIQFRPDYEAVPRTALELLAHPRPDQPNRQANVRDFDHEQPACSRSL